MPYRKNPLGTVELGLLARERLAHEAADFSSSEPSLETAQALKIRLIECELQNEHLEASRAQLEVALNRSGELYELAPVGKLSLGPNGNIIKLNRACTELLGGDRSQLLSNALAMYLQKARQAAFRVLLDQAFASGETQSGEFAVSNGAGVVRHVVLTMASLPDRQSCQVELTDITGHKAAEEALRVNEERWKYALDAAGDGVWDWNVRTGAVMFSRRFAQLYGFDDDDYGIRLEDLTARIHSADKARVMADMQAHLSGSTRSFSNEHRGLCKDGSWKWVLSRGTVVTRGKDGRALRVIGTHVDISSQKQAQYAQLVSNHLQQAVFDALSTLIAVLDRQGHVVQTNSAWKDFAQVNSLPESCGSVGSNYFNVLDALIGRGHGVMLFAAWQSIAAVTARRMPSFEVEYSFQAPTQKRWFVMRVTPVSDVHGRVVVSHEEVTRLKTAELANLTLANMDVLTGAMSRRHFLEVAEHEFSRSHRYNLPLMVMMLDLDHFKQINDQYGHAAGDEVLCSFVHTVRAVLRESDAIGRLGGEEFSVLLPNTTLEGGLALAHRVVERVRESPVTVEDKRIAYTVSVGVSCLLKQVTFLDLLKRADAALYQAKMGGRDAVQLDEAVGNAIGDQVDALKAS